MLGTDHPGVDSLENVRPLPDPAPGGFNDHPVAIPYTVLPGRFRVDLHHRVPVKFPEPGDLTIFSMEEAGQSPARNEDIGVLLKQFRGAVGTLRRLPVPGQGIITSDKAALWADAEDTGGDGAKKWFTMILNCLLKR